ncbi:PREDICTED: N-acetylglucosamine-6-sulfatase-like isoform X2 [Priapulus caudatus]|uniref:N-acetylglucosamine-6-sulfatase-like isoform X2 n=1 Tax=Priapulus caudatus TaxID=37621 RepID=A0ABM1E6C8_PRICU|nr:PREDICTED: N-acetylglucosamine-6-sulfatase-like isoform X2 [Priapulus caudatus]
MSVAMKVHVRLFFTFVCLIWLCHRVSTQNSIDSGKPPNIVFILTDDQDSMLGGVFATTPICCPSRGSILTGNYAHNTHIVNNSLSGNCSSKAWQSGPEKHSFATYLKEQGYKTFFAGKYLNQYGKSEAGGVEHVPPGWDEWHGLVGNSVYYNYVLSANGKKESHGDNYEKDYLTDVIHKKAVKYLREKVRPHGNPFFMMLSTPACHQPFTPAPQYAKNFSNLQAPRNGSFDKPGGKGKHWLLRQPPNPMDNTTLALIDDFFRNRWRTLLSVDDMVEDVINVLEKLALLENTYVFFTSDHGYHLGQFSLPFDKRQLYDFDIRVPMMVRGPGIKPASHSDELVLTIDLAPTFVDIAGGGAPSEMDGMSLTTLLVPSKKVTLPHWRGEFLVEYDGEYQTGPIPGCPQYIDGGVSECYRCICDDAKNNTYSCAHYRDQSNHYVYCVFDDTENFVEVYDLAADPDQLNNIVATIDKKLLAMLNDRLIQLLICAGPSCKIVHPQYNHRMFNVQEAPGFSLGDHL